MTFQGYMYSFDFDVWRQNYDSMSLDDQKAYHSLLWGQFKDQHQHSDDGPVLDFFDGLATHDLHVLEIGGWTGDSAANVLYRHPNIESWQNIEICMEAILASETSDGRYSALCPSKWPWEMDLSGHNVLFMQHVIEHMKAAQFAALIDASPDVRWAFIQSPLDMEPRNWAGYVGCHIMEVGWNGIDDIMVERGFTLVGHHWDGARWENSRTRVYERED